MYWHLTLAADERLTLFPDAARRRRAVRALVHTFGAAALLFFVVDDHLHVIVSATRKEAGRLAQALAIALRHFAATELQPARIRPVEGRAHLQSQVPYVLDQATHHRLPGHPADQLGSCFPDLVGARVLGFATQPLREALPRLSLNQVFAAVKLPVLAPLADLDGVPLPELIRAGADAVGAGGLRGAEPAVIGARATVVRLAIEAGYRRDRVARALATTPRSLHRLLALAETPEIEAAVRMRLALDRAVGRPPADESEP